MTETEAVFKMLDRLTGKRSISTTGLRQWVISDDSYRMVIDWDDSYFRWHEHEQVSNGWSRLDASGFDVEPYELIEIIADRHPEFVKRLAEPLK